MKDRTLTIISLLFAIAAIGYAAWVHRRVDALVYEAVRKREQELVRDWAPKMDAIYRDMLAGTRVRLPENPQTLQELFEPLFYLTESLGGTPKADINAKRNE